MSLLKEVFRPGKVNIFSLKVRSRKESLKLICREQLTLSWCQSRGFFYAGTSFATLAESYPPCADRKKIGDLNWDDLNPKMGEPAAALELIPACGLTREHQPMSVPKKGRKSVAFSGITATWLSFGSAS